MANPDSAYGFLAVKQVGGGDPIVNGYSVLGYSIATGYAVAMARGTSVVITGTADADGRPNIEVCPVNTKMTGVLKSVEYDDTATGQHIVSEYWPASTAATNIVANVWDHQDTIFSIQCDEDLVVGDIGAKADWTPTNGQGVSSTKPYHSTIELDSSDITTGDALIILGKEQGSNFAENFTRALVLVNEHAKRGALTAV